MDLYLTHFVSPITKTGWNVIYNNITTPILMLEDYELERLYKEYRKQKRINERKL